MHQELVTAEQSTHYSQPELDPNAEDEKEQTALMWAAAEGHKKVVEVLIGAGADINHILGSGFTPLFFAVREGNIDVSLL